MMFVAVDALDLDGDAVDPKDAVDDLDLLEPGPLWMTSTVLPSASFRETRWYTDRASRPSTSAAYQRGRRSRWPPLLRRQSKCAAAIWCGFATGRIEQSNSDFVVFDGLPVRFCIFA